MAPAKSYLMENPEEIIRLEIKTDPDAVRKQGHWCGIKPGIHVLEVGCGSGKVTSILHEMIQPEGSILGIDFSEDRINYARENHGQRVGIDFEVRDVRDPLDDVGQFDLIWVRFFLEYYRLESADIIRNLNACLKPGGALCLLDLDHNCLSHYELPAPMEKTLFEVMKELEQKYDFDPYSGRKLYAYLYDLGYQDIQLNLMAHHLIYGELDEIDLFNWIKKLEAVFTKTKELFNSYPGGQSAFFSDFKEFFLHPRRFTYTPLILCKGTKPMFS